MPRIAFVANNTKLPVNGLFLLYGPPGIGKSTLIQDLSLEGKVALDLEQIPVQQRKDPRLLKRPIFTNLINAPRYIGTADLQPGSFSAIRKSTYHILLMLDRASYEDRKKAREASAPWKANQLDVYDGFLNRAKAFDLVMINKDIQDTVDFLIALGEMSTIEQTRDKFDVVELVIESEN